MCAAIPRSLFLAAHGTVTSRWKGKPNPVVRQCAFSSCSDAAAGIRMSSSSPSKSNAEPFLPGTQGVLPSTTALSLRGSASGRGKRVRTILTPRARPTQRRADGAAPAPGDCVTTRGGAGYTKAGTVARAGRYVRCRGGWLTLVRCSRRPCPSGRAGPTGGPRLRYAGW